MKELFIVEGLSAASTLKQSLDKEHQAVFAIQGKLINCLKVSKSKVLKDEMCTKLFLILGCGVGEDCSPNDLAFSSVNILGDPDMDGLHARILLFQIFSEFLQPLVKAQKVFNISTPLYKVWLHEKEQQNDHYIWTREELKKYKKKYPFLMIVQSFKSVSQYSHDECKELLTNQSLRQRLS